MTAYIAYLRKNKDSDYGVEFPDLPGCISAGHTLEEAQAMAAEALVGHISVLREMGESVPAPSSVARLAEDLHRGNAMMVSINLASSEQKLSA